mgnify:CR=1 FL=1
MKYMFASDIHGSAYYCRKMLDAFEKEGAERLVLLGDLLYHGPRNDLPEGYAPKEVIALLQERQADIFCVRGNCEAEVDQMARNTHDFNQAIAAGNAADVRRLLSTGITPNIVLENGDTPLTWALRSESWDLARVLLDAQGIDVNMENRHGETPLMLAVIKGREAEFDRLLKLGAKVNKTRGWTPLHYAATEGRTSMMKRLIELGADVNAQTLSLIHI